MNDNHKNTPPIMPDGVYSDVDALSDTDKAEGSKTTSGEKKHRKPREVTTSRKSYTNFDLKATLNPGEPISLQELYRRLSQEYDSTKEKRENYSNCIDFFNINKQNYGLIQKLSMYLNLDVREQKSDTPEMWFDKLKLLKFLYDIEIATNHRQPALAVLPKGQIKLIDTMAHPSFDKIDSSYSNATASPSDFNTVMQVLREHANNHKQSEQKIDEIIHMWEELRGCLMLHLIAVNKTETEKLNSMAEALSALAEKYQPNTAPQQPEDGAINTFYQMMYIKQYQAILDENLSIDYHYGDKETSSEIFLGFLSPYADDPFFKKSMKWEEFVKFFKTPETINEKYGKIIWSLLLGKIEPTLDDAKKIDRIVYNFVVKEGRAESLTKLWMNSDQLTAAGWFVIVQELMSIRNNPEFRLPKTSKQQTLTAAVKHIDNADPKPRMVLLNRLKNRQLFLFGIAQAHQTYIKLMKCIYELEKTVFSYCNLSDIQKTNREIFIQVVPLITSKPYITIIVSRLKELICSKLKICFPNAVTRLGCSDNCYQYSKDIELFACLVWNTVFHDEIAIPDSYNAQNNDIVLFGVHFVTEIGNPDLFKSQDCDITVLANLFVKEICNINTLQQISPSRKYQRKITIPLHIYKGYQYTCEIQFSYSPNDGIIVFDDIAIT